MMFLSGCFGKKYNLICGSDFETKKKKYEAGEKVVLKYSLIATDTDYSFYSNDVKLKQVYDSGEGYVFTFVMPAHDVKVSVSHRNSMMYDPTAGIPKTEEQLLAIAANSELVFDYYDGTAGTDGFDGHDEYRLYREQDGGLIMTKTSDWPDRKEQRACSVWDDVVYELLDVVDKYDMRHWTEGSPIDGQAYTVKFAEADRMITVGSGLVPENGLKAFGAVQQVMEKTWKMFSEEQ